MRDPTRTICEQFGAEYHAKQGSKRWLNPIVTLLFWRQASINVFFEHLKEEPVGNGR
jgi:hypothetical protein